MPLSSEFLVTALIVVLVPGTGVIYTLSAGLFSGQRASLLAAVGCTLGIVPHLLASFLGLSAIMNMGAEAFTIIKLLGVAYLLYLAWGMWRGTGALVLGQPTGSRAAVSIISRGVLVNLLNPKLTVFFLAFLPQFVTPGSSGLAQMLTLSAAFMAMTLVVFVLYGLLAGTLRERVIASPRTVQRLQRVFAGIFAVLALRLAVQER